jgi:hypothetical protein
MSPTATNFFVTGFSPPEFHAPTAPRSTDEHSVIDPAVQLPAAVRVDHSKQSLPSDWLPLRDEPVPNKRGAAIALIDPQSTMGVA